MDLNVKCLLFLVLSEFNPNLNVWTNISKKFHIMKLHENPLVESRPNNTKIQT